MTRRHLAVPGRRAALVIGLSLLGVVLNALFPTQAFAQNTAPVIQTSAGLTLSEGGSAVIDSSLLLATDAEQGADSLAYTVVTEPACGVLSPGTGFTQAQIDAGGVTYTHDGGETTLDYFTFIVSDGVGGATPATSFIVTITPVNDPPVLAVNNTLTLDEGGVATIDAGTLQVTDPDDPPAQLTYTVTGEPVSGTVTLSGSPLSTGSTFTQEDVNVGLLSYAHDGSETATDALLFSFSDGETMVPGNAMTIAITAVNDAPVLAVNDGLTVSEGGSGLIDNEALQVTDAEQGASSLTYTVSEAPTSGTLSPATGFTQAQIDAGSVTYTHDGSEATSDGFTFSVSDGAGGTIPATSFIIDITPVNDPPVLVVNDTLTLNEGDTATIDAGTLQVTDPDDPPAQLTYTVSVAPTNGTLSPATGFTQAQIDAGSVTYTHDGGESLSDGFTFVVSDGVGGTIPPTTFSITIMPVNDAPVIAVNDGLTVSEGGSGLIDNEALQVTDAEQGPASITYTVSVAPTSGTLSPATGFTQAQIDAGSVTYTHDGSEATSDGFAFSVSDGVGGTIPSTSFTIDIMPVNDAPVLAVNDTLTLNEGETAAIDASTLQVTDPDDPPAQLTYTVSVAPANGILALSGSPLSPGSTFTQDDVNFGLLSYAHDGGETTTDEFLFTVSDGQSAALSSTFHITITSANDSPVLAVNDGLTVSEGGAGVIDDEVLQVTDEEEGPAALTYTVSEAPTSGTLSPATGFTQAQIDAGSVTYTHDGGETLSDHFRFSVSDGAGATVSGTFVITITPVDDPPSLADNNGLSIERGESEPITRGQLLADDPDTPPANLLFTVTGQPTEGTLLLSGSPGPSTFTQDDIDYGRLRYEHGGSSAVPDSFSFDLADLTSTVGPFTFAITVEAVSEEPPEVMSIVDVGNDQGRSVLITFEKCGADTLGSHAPVVEYGAFRRIDPVASADGSEGDEATRLDGWVFVGSVPANGEPVYNMVAPTLADSTAGGGIHWSVFFIRALTAEPTTYFDSPPDSGYSVDNLAPGVPMNLAYENPGVLTWDDVPDADLDFYTAYGSASETFDETAEVLGHATAPTFDVQGQVHAHYFVTATDFSGNEGDPAAIANPTGIPGQASVLKVGISAHPNPFNPSTVIVYTVEEAGPVTVTVYDAVGKLVATLVDNEYREPDEYRLEYRPRGASGVYFARMESGERTAVRKMVLLK